MKANRIPLKALDERLAFIAGQGDKLNPPAGGWLRSVRNGLGISQREAAALAGVTQQAFDQFEAGELKASITLERLQKAAAALGCEVVYFLKPTEAAGGTFVSLPERQAKDRKPASKPTQRPTDYRQSEDLPVNLL
jgi:transcriptional regulator with XRE-family HTH domain